MLHAPAGSIAAPQRHAIQAMKLVTYGEAAQLLRISRATLERMVARAECPQPFQVAPGTVRFDATELEAWVSSRRKTASGRSVKDLI